MLPGPVLQISPLRMVQSGGLIRGVNTFLSSNVQPVPPRANPASLAETETREGAYLSGHMESHTNTFPDFYGRMENPSGRFPCEQYKTWLSSMPYS